MIEILNMQKYTVWQLKQAFESSQNSSGSMGSVDWTMRGPVPVLEGPHFLIFLLHTNDLTLIITSTFDK